MRHMISRILYLFVSSAVILSLSLLSPLLDTACAEPGDTNGRSVYGAEMYTGWSMDTEGQWFGYLGLGLDRTISDHWALTVKTFGSYSYYDYESGLRVITAKAPGAKLMIGGKYFDTGVLLVMTGGLDYRDTSLSPDDTGSSVRGSQTGAVFEVLYLKDLTERSVIELLGSFSTIGDSLWGRARYKHLIPSLSKRSSIRKVYAGIEVIGEGNSDYTAYRIGPLFEIQNISKNISLLFDAGYKHTDSVSSAGYFGIELYHRF